MEKIEFTKEQIKKISESVSLSVLGVTLRTRMNMRFWSTRK